MYSTASHEVTSSSAAAAVVKMGKFTMKRNVQRQLREFAGLRASEPEKARRMHDQGEALISLAQQGKFTKLRNFINALEVDEIPTYYVVRAYKAALIGGHLMVVSLFIDEGFPFSKASVPAVLLEIMSEMDDDECHNMVEFLLAKGYDVNLAAQGTWLTALHVSIRYGLLRTASLLIDKGADINAVADGDVMPLPLAKKLLSLHCDEEDEVAGRVEYLPDPIGEEQAQDENTQREGAIAEWKARKEEITMFVKGLIRKGARVNWRKDADRARAAADRSSVGTTGGAAEAPEKPKMRSFAGTVSKNTAMSVEEARVAFARAGVSQTLKAEGGTPLPSPATTTTTSSAPAKPKSRRKLVVSDIFEEEILPPPTPSPGDKINAEDGVLVSESDDGAQLFSTG